MQTIYMTIGMIGSGKSDWANHKVEEESNILILNRDSLRSMIKDKYVYQRDTEEVVRKMMFASLSIMLRAGYDVIIDETHLTVDKRRIATDAVRNELLDAEVVFVEFPEHGDNLNWRMRNARGISREVWSTVLDDMRNVYEEPTVDEDCSCVITAKSTGGENWTWSETLKDSGE